MSLSKDLFGIAPEPNELKHLKAREIARSILDMHESDGIPIEELVMKTILGTAIPALEASGLSATLMLEIETILAAYREILYRYFYYQLYHGGVPSYTEVRKLVDQAGAQSIEQRLKEALQGKKIVDTAQKEE